MTRGRTQTVFQRFLPYPLLPSLLEKKKEKKKEFPSSSSSSLPSSLMPKFPGSQRCCLCNDGKGRLRHIPQQYSGPQLTSRPHHEAQMVCMACLGFSTQHIQVRESQLGLLSPLWVTLR